MSQEQDKQVRSQVAGLNNQSVKRRLALGFGVLVLLLIVSGFVSYWQIEKIDSALLQIVNIEEPLEQAVLEMEIYGGETARAILHHIHQPDEKFRDQAAASELKFTEYSDRYQKLVENEEERRLGHKVLQNYSEFRILGDELIRISTDREVDLEELRAEVATIDVMLDHMIEGLVERNTPRESRKLVALLRMQVEIEKAFAVVEAYTAMHLPEMKQELELAITNFQKQSQTYLSGGLSQSEQQFFKRITQQFENSIADAREVIVFTDRLELLSKRFESDLESMDIILDNVIQPLIHEETVRAAQEAMSSSRTAVLTLATLGVLGALFGGCVGWHISRGIIGPVTLLVHGSRLIGEGDKDHRIETGSQDEFGDLASAFNSMVDKLNQSSEELLDIQKETERLKLQAARQEIERHAAAARTDQLTKLHNRRAFDDLMNYHQEESVVAGESVAMVLFDVDKFKTFNDDYGHQAGDAVLQGVASTLATVFEAPNCVARFGGEEFAAILPSCTLAEAAQKAEEARQAIENAVFEFDGRQLKVSASGGVARLTKDTDIEMVIRHSDEALYVSKDAGRNCIHVHEDGKPIPATQYLNACEQESLL